MTRKIIFVEGEYYHLFGRGNRKQPIFLEQRDYIRFLFCILFFQSPVTFTNIGRQVSYFEKNGCFSIDMQTYQKIISAREVELTAFALMPNHYHLENLEVVQGGSSRYMEKVLKSYTKYFNTKYAQAGHLFQGPFKNTHVRDNDYLLYLSAYIHRNPRELKGWEEKEEEYEWSSYQDYTKKNRWGGLLNTSTILEQFKSADEYREYLENSPAKSDLDE